MAYTKHKDLTTINIHAPHTQEYANSTARLTATGFVASDKLKWALDLDTKKFFILKNNSPITQVPAT